MVYVPTAEYMLALKVKAIRVLDPLKGDVEARDIRNLMQVTGTMTAEQAVAVMAKYFAHSAVEPDKQLFLLRHLLNTDGAADAPQYPIRSL